MVHDMGGRREEFGSIDRSDHQVEDWERLADAVTYGLPKVNERLLPARQARQGGWCCTGGG